MKLRNLKLRSLAYLARSLSLLWIMMLAAEVAASQQEKALVLTTIKPLTMIAEAVLGDEFELRQVLPDQEIPHHYSLRMSDRRLFDQAQLVLWVGPELEHFMASLLAQRDSSTVIRASELEAMAWPVISERGRDDHLWLNPQNALVIARALVAQASTFEQANPAILKAQLRVFEDEIDVLMQQIRKRLLSVSAHKFIVDHDAFRHFTETFGLQDSGFLRDSAGVDIGARARAEVMGQKEVRCVVVEPESRRDRILALAAEWGANWVMIDPLGASEVADDDSNEWQSAYAQMIHNIAEKFYHCLQGA